MIVVNMKALPIPTGRWFYIGRPTLWGNPFELTSESERDLVLLKFAEYWYAPKQKWIRERAMRELPADSTLLCYCAPKRCHGDIIAGYLAWKRTLDKSS